MMVPRFRRALIVKEHGNLPSPEGMGRRAHMSRSRASRRYMARTAYLGLFFSLAYAVLQQSSASSRRPGYVTPPPPHLPRRDVERGVSPSTWASATSSARRSQGVLWRSACWAGWGSSASSPRWCRGPDRRPAREARYLVDLNRRGRLRLVSPTHPCRRDEPGHLIAPTYRPNRRGRVRRRRRHAPSEILPTIVAAFRAARQPARRRRSGSTSRTNHNSPIGVVNRRSGAEIAILALLPFLSGHSRAHPLGLLIVVFASSSSRSRRGFVGSSAPARTRSPV